jgi:hypothetical protein
LLSYKPEVFSVSSEIALSIKNKNNSIKENSLLEKDEIINNYDWNLMEKFIFDTLESKEKIELKLKSPLGVLDKLLSKYENIIKERISILYEGKN